VSIVARYRDYLTARATGLTRAGWYAESGKQAMPWALLTIALCGLGTLAPQANRIAVIFALFVPGFIGFVVTQVFMMTVHLKDYNARMRAKRG
jgi:hypothetical protein